jgi:hypothetical protein
VRILAWLAGRDLGPETHGLSRRVFLTLLGVCYLAAFLSLEVQVESLVGSRGIAPAAPWLAEVEKIAGASRLWRVPTLLWLSSADVVLHLLCLAGAAGAVLLALGAAPRLLCAALFAVYLSLVSVGGIFLRYQWDALLLETGFLAIWLAPARLRPSAAAREPVEPLALWLLRCLLFKLMFMSGAVKLLSGDPSWRDLSAMQFHYWTQPLPNALSWFAWQLPAWLHRASVVATFVAELALPFLIFAPRRLRCLACAGTLGLMLGIGATGNYGFFNLLTCALALLLLDDAALRRLLPQPAARALRRALPRCLLGEPVPPERARRRGWPPARIAFAGLALLLLAASAQRMLDRFGIGPRPLPLAALVRVAAPFQLANPYGLFSVMTTSRNEIEVEGSDDGRVFRPYRFRWKPGPVERRPGFAGLHMPRLDWQLWFAALGGCAGTPWFQGFQRRLLEGEPSVLALLDANPFPDAPPRYLRSRLHAYRFAPPGSAAWWQREPLGPFCPGSVSLP